MHLVKDNESNVAEPSDDGQRALVLARWNSWVRLYFPETGEMAWVDLREVGFEILETGVISKTPE